PWRWAIGAGVAGGLVGTTRLVGENVANLMNVMLVAVGFLLLVRFVVRGQGCVAGVLRLVAAGVARWPFRGGLALGVVGWLGGPPSREGGSRSRPPPGCSSHTGS